MFNIKRTGRTKLSIGDWFWLKPVTLYEYEATDWFDVGCGLRGEATVYFWDVV